MRENLQLKILNNKLGTELPLPQYATKGSAGMDLRACLDKPLMLKPNEAKLIPTGLAIYIRDPNYAGIILPRSGLGHKQGIIMGNGIGLIDADYQGELKISCWNRSTTSYTVNVGDRIAQFVLIPVQQANLEIVTQFCSETERAVGGFGHTGVT